ncbi:MFS transporter [Lapillicoccus sp.]|uniref:MFS transporter n=1 Tax=Lapillicoccus sp. TaxID=1909287 RepID=UPI0025E67E34|nr:MFS transporter [Lapillicoccus sp.]
MRSRTRRPSLFRHRDLRIVLPAVVGVGAGDALVMFALTLRIFTSGGGPAQIALLTAAFAIPTILCVGIAGYVVDRYDSRTILLLTSLTQGIAVAGLALSPPAMGMYLLVVLLQVGQSFASPTWAALLPRIVGEEDLGRASALQQSSLLLTGAVGAAGAGVLVARYGVPATLWVATIGFLGVGVAALAVTTRRVGETGSASSASVSPLTRLWSSEGFAVLRADRVNWVLFSATIPFLLALETINIAEVFLVKGTLGATTTEFGILQAVSAVGAIGGAWFSARIMKEATRVVVVVAGIGAGGVGMALAGLAPNVVVLGVASVIIGSCVMASGSALFPVLMLRTADKDRGKVNAAVSGANRTMTMLALGVGAVAGTLLSPRHIFVAAAVVSVVVAAWSWHATRDLLAPEVAQDSPAVGDASAG